MSVDLNRDGPIAIVTIGSENGFNVADLPTMTELRTALATLAEDRAARAVILTGAGDRAFCAGADIKYMRTLDADGGEAWARLGHEIGHLLETMPRVTIAAINGLALGGGSELALACDLRYASPTARIGQPEVNYGIVPGWGGTQRIARLAGVGFAKELVLTGRLVGAEEALARGLVNAIHDPVLAGALDAARTVAAKGPVAIAAAKELCNRALHGDHGANLDTEAAALGRLFGTPEADEGLCAFVEKRDPDYSGSSGP